MAWKQVKRTDTLVASSGPFIGINRRHFSFSTKFVRAANITIGHQVTIYVDEENFKLAFEFHDDDRPDSYVLVHKSKKAGQIPKEGHSLSCSAQAIVNRYAWIRSVARLPFKDRRFPPRKEGSYWVIQLCPAFEIRKARETQDIPSDAKGIYRYVRETGEVVYIGMGAIRERLSSPDRRDWDFAVVEYSIVEDPDKRVEWEGYWIERYKEENAGNLPFYNSVSGQHRLTQ